ncbi:MAG: 6,7-dimethyl-8-ribityllumazine synthase [Bacteroidales bacterium]
MATILKNLSSYDPNQIPDAKKMNVGIVVSDWNDNITHALLRGAVETLIKHGVSEENITVKHVPGAFELTYGANYLVNNTSVDGVIVLGCVIKGDTPHFDYVCQGVTYGIAKLNAEQEIPVIFGVLTTDNLQQALDRADGIHGNKGVEAAVTVIKMIDFSWSLE